VTTIHVLGSEGFIGRAVQHAAGDLDLQCWSHQQSKSHHHFNLLDSSSWKLLLSYRPTHVILLSWPGLPSYDEPFHVTHNLPACIDLVEQLISSGLRRIVIAGTCYEYGLQNGPLKEDQPTDPVNCYAVAKDSLRRVVASRCAQRDVEWCWARIFYPFGTGQNPESLLPSLQRALDRGDHFFAMSSGRQIRDFVAVEQVARVLLQLALEPSAHGIYNCGSGNPINLRELVELRIKESSSRMHLQLGAFPDRTDEPVAFWADTSKLIRL
jgi:nucleoside-diphosphate-sugar epimerase